MNDFIGIVIISTGIALIKYACVYLLIKIIVMDEKNKIEKDVINIFESQIKVNEQVRKNINNLKEEIKSISGNNT